MVEAERIPITFRRVMGDSRDLPKRGPSMAEQLAQGEKMLGGLETELEERTRPMTARTQQGIRLPKPLQPEGEPQGEAEDLAPALFPNRRPRRNRTLANVIDKHAALTMVITSSDGDTTTVTHEHRTLMRTNKQFTAMVLGFGFEQILIYDSRRLDILRDAIAARQIDDVRPAPNPGLDGTYPELEHIGKVVIRSFRPIVWGSNGEIVTIDERGEAVDQHGG